MGNPEERFDNIIIIENPQRLQDKISNYFIEAVAHKNNVG